MDVTELISIGRGHCPDCGHRGFVIGPMAGPTPMAINLECGNLDCRSRFNAVFYASAIVTAQRIDGGGAWASDPDNPQPAGS